MIAVSPEMIWCISNKGQWINTWSRARQLFGAPLLLLCSPLKSPYAHAYCNMHTAENNKNAVHEGFTHKRATDLFVNLKFIGPFIILTVE